MEGKGQIVSLGLNFGANLGGPSLGLNSPLNFSKLNFRKGNDFMIISLFKKLNFRSCRLEFSLGGVLTPLNSKLNFQI